MLNVGKTVNIRQYPSVLDISYGCAHWIGHGYPTMAIMVVITPIVHCPTSGALLA